LLKIAQTLEEPIIKFLDIPINVSFNNCNGSGLIVYHQLPPELLKLLKKLAFKI
jgi:hypothetical protein